MNALIGWCVWITGLPGSGKSVITRALLELLNKKKYPTQILSSDELRKVLTPHPNYDLNERDIVYATMTYIAKMLTQNGINVIIDATGNLRRYRDSTRTQIPAFMEVYIECPLELCIQREAIRKETYSAPTHIYQKALENTILSTVPGIGQPYEAPLNPEITINFNINSQEAAQQIYEILVAKNNTTF
jgi:adenylylsulfate kinase